MLILRFSKSEYSGKCFFINTDITEITHITHIKFKLFIIFGSGFKFYKSNIDFMVLKSTSICWITIIKTTISPVKVVIIACSSRPDRIKTWLSTATIMPIAAILNIKSTFKFKNFSYKNKL